MFSVTKKKSAPKPIQYRGVTLNFDKGTGRYVTEDRQIFLYKDHWADDSWAAGVIVDLPPDEDGIIVYGSAETVQEAIDIALDNALECIDNHMKTVAEQKTNLLKIRNF